MQSLPSHRGKALSQYRAGTAKANQGDFTGSTVDCTVVIHSKDATAAVKATA